MNAYIAIFLGGGFGSLCRFGLSRMNLWGYALPLGTMAANFLSCIVLGFVVAFFASKTSLSPGEQAIKLFFAVGFCGGFSTFSTFTLETLLMLQKGDFVTAFGHISLSIVVCLVALMIGFFCAK